MVGAQGRGMHRHVPYSAGGRARRRSLRRSARLLRQPGRPLQQPDRAQRPLAAGRAARRAGRGRGRACGRGHARAARHGHAAGGPHRGRCIAGCAAGCAPRSLAARLPLAWQHAPASMQSCRVGNYGHHKGARSVKAMLTDHRRHSQASQSLADRTATPAKLGACRPPQCSGSVCWAADNPARAPHPRRPACATPRPVAAGAAWPLQTSAAKSHTGHAEPAAGAVGVAALAFSLPLALSRPTCHLRQVRQALLACTRSPRVFLGRCQCMGWRFAHSSLVHGRP